MGPKSLVFVRTREYHQDMLKPKGQHLGILHIIAALLLGDHICGKDVPNDILLKCSHISGRVLVDTSEERMLQSLLGSNAHISIPLQAGQDQVMKNRFVLGNNVKKSAWHGVRTHTKLVTTLLIKESSELSLA